MHKDFLQYTSSGGALSWEQFEASQTQSAGAKRARSSIPVRASFSKQQVSPELKKSVQKFVLQKVFGSTKYNESSYIGENPELPGPYPASMNHSKLQVVKDTAYAVCEKSDGERAMLLIIKSDPNISEGVYIIDRKFHVELLKCCADYVNELASMGPLLVEGELIIRSSDMGTGTNALVVFMMFDCICARGKDIAALYLPQRLALLKTDVREPFKAFDIRRNREVPLYLLTKSFVDKKNVGEVLSKIITYSECQYGLTAPVESEMVAGPICHRLYNNGINVNGTDGLIFTPEQRSYRELLSGTPQIIKWKFTDENTVDFRVYTKDFDKVADYKGPQQYHTVPLYISLGMDDRQVCSTSVTVEEASAYYILGQRLKLESLIVECAFQPKLSTWKIKKIRDKKSKANSLRTAWSTLEAVTENITPEELVSFLRS